MATELVVSTKTVEYHLGNIYAKLGVHSRGKLQERLMAGAGVTTTTTPPAGPPS